MKRFWLVLLSLGLVMAFSASVFAADVKFSGSYYAAGMYQDKTTFIENPYAYTWKSGAMTAPGVFTRYTGPSTAFYYQRLRVQTEFIATPALKLITRFDALERVWGGARSTTGANDPISGAFVGASQDPDSYGTRAENENIAFDYAYIWYASPIGIWQVGIMSDGAWGTKFADNDSPAAKIGYMFVKMPLVLGVQIAKLAENSYTAVSLSPYADVDTNKYQAYGIFNFTGGSAGVIAIYQRGASTRPQVLSTSTGFYTNGYQQNLYIVMPYVKAKIGPVSIEAEVDYAWGKVAKWDEGLTGPADLYPNVKVSDLQAYVDAVADFGVFYVGGTAAFIDGDKASTTDKMEGGVLSGGRDWNPCLIMFNWDRYYWAGAIPGYLTATYPTTLVASQPSMGAPMTNAYFGQLRAGVRPVAPLDIMGSVSYAQAVRNAAVASPYLLPSGLAGLGGAQLTDDKDYGWEIDVTATYKITNNLTYMLGGGYLFTGDYYKGMTGLNGWTQGNHVQDNFLVINKLTLTF